MVASLHTAQFPFIHSWTTMNNWEGCVKFVPFDLPWTLFCKLWTSQNSSQTFVHDLVHAHPYFWPINVSEAQIICNIQRNLERSTLLQHLPWKKGNIATGWWQMKSGEAKEVLFPLSKVLLVTAFKNLVNGPVLKLGINDVLHPLYHPFFCRFNYLGGARLCPSSLLW